MADALQTSFLILPVVITPGLKSPSSSSNYNIITHKVKSPSLSRFSL